jgi:pilus assembly protein CpaB
MNKRFISVLLFAFVVATVASLLLYRLLINRPQQATAAPNTVQIVVASHDLEVGTVLKEEDLKVTNWPNVVPAGAAAKTQDLVGRGVTNRMVDKEPVLDSRLAAKGAGGGLAATIPPGMRAVAIRVNEVVGVAGFVVAGMRVDVLISGNRPGAGEGMGTMTKTLLQNIEVLSAGQDYKKDAEGKPVLVQVVNLLVTPEQAEQLSLASAQTAVQLVLRNPLDREIAKTTGTALSYLFTGGKPAPSAAPSGPRQPRYVAPPVAVVPAAPKKEQFVMEIISGKLKSEQKFEHTGEGK